MLQRMCRLSHDSHKLERGMLVVELASRDADIESRDMEIATPEGRARYCKEGDFIAWCRECVACYTILEYPG